MFLCTAAESLQSCPTLCNPVDDSPPGSPVPGTLQARTLEWVAIAFSNAWKWKVKVKSLSRVQLLATLWTATYQAPLSMEFSRQEYWSGVPLPSPAMTMTCPQNMVKYVALKGPCWLEVGPCQLPLQRLNHDSHKMLTFNTPLKGVQAGDKKIRHSVCSGKNPGKQAFR